MTKKMKRFLVGAMVLMLALTGCSASKVNEVDMSEYVQVSVEGKNGLATAEIILLNAELNALVNEGVDKEDQVDVSELVGVKADPVEGIMNGDKINVVVELDEKLKDIAKDKKLSFTNLEFEHEVKGLEGAVVLEEADVFADILVKEDGDKLEVVNNSENRVMKQIEYSVVKEGDSYKVTAKTPEALGGKDYTSDNVTVVDKDNVEIKTQKPANTVKEVDKGSVDDSIKFVIETLEVYSKPGFPDSYYEMQGLLDNYHILLKMIANGQSLGDVQINEISPVKDHGFLEIKGSEYHVVETVMSTGTGSETVFIGIQKGHEDLKVAGSILYGKTIDTIGKR